MRFSFRSHLFPAEKPFLSGTWFLHMLVARGEQRVTTSREEMQDVVVYFSFRHRHLSTFFVSGALHACCNVSVSFLLPHCDSRPSLFFFSFFFFSFTAPASFLPPDRFAPGTDPVSRKSIATRRPKTGLPLAAVALTRPSRCA